MSFENVIADALELKELFDDEEWWKNRFKHLRVILNIRKIVKSIVGNNLVDDSATVEDNVTVKGTVIICEHTLIRHGTYMQGPLVIGENCKIGPNCFLNGNIVVGPNSRIGQGAELKSSVLISDVAMYHFSYIGNSIVGRNANIGAGVISAVRRFDSEYIVVKSRTLEVNTFQRKFGALIGDEVQLGVGVLIYPGRTIAPRSRVYPGTVVDKNIYGE